MRIPITLFVSFIVSLNIMAQTIDIIETSDVHGNFFPRDFVYRIDGPGSLARVSTYVNKFNPETTLLLDNGDLLQGQPPLYYYNYVDTLSKHIAPRVMNYIGYDGCSIGNHDIETGHAVYDRIHYDFNYPTIVANIINEKTGKPYFTPYNIYEKGGKKIAVLGMVTPAIPAWLPKKLWDGMRFEDMEETARKWMPIIQAEKPDLIIGLFHSGNDSTRNVAGFKENASLQVAKNVPGFHLILTGHDHIPMVEDIVNIAGESVLVLNPGASALNVAHARVTFGRDLDIVAKIESLDKTAPDNKYLSHFSKTLKTMEKYVEQKIGNARGDFACEEAFYGPSAFMTLLHTLQLVISGADISFAAPLSNKAIIRKGDITVADMFKLYKYENGLYVIQLTGKEIKDYLERSYALWTRQLSSSSREGLLLNQNPSYNFDSAQGIEYIVDVTKPAGEKVTIFSLSDGQPFEFDKKYNVAVNSYRAEGGGDLLTKGAGIPRDSLASRVVWRSDRDLRHYLSEQIYAWGEITPTVKKNWEFVPSDITTRAISIDRGLDPSLDN